MDDNHHAKKNKKIKVGFDATWMSVANKTGVGFYTEELVTSLAKNHKDLELVGHYFSWHEAKNLPVDSNIRYLRTRFLPRKAIGLLKLVGLDIPFELLAHERFDFLIFPSFTTLPSLFKTPSTAVIHDLAYIDMPETLIDINRYNLAKSVPRSLKRSKFITAVSNSTKKRIIEVYKTSKDIVITYPSPIDKPAANHEFDLKKMYNIEGKYLLFVGTLEPRKNILGLLEAYSLLAKAVQEEYALVLAGNMGWKNESIIKSLESLKENKLKIILTGYVGDEMRNYLLKKASLSVMPSFYEGFGMPLLEAMVQNTAVVASDIAIFHEVCGTAAKYFDPKNPEDMSRAISDVLNNKDLSNELIKNGKANLQRFSWQESADKVYKKILEYIN